MTLVNWAKRFLRLKSLNISEMALNTTKLFFRISFFYESLKLFTKIAGKNSNLKWKYLCFYQRQWNSWEIVVKIEYTIFKTLQLSKTLAYYISKNNSKI